MRIRPHLIGVAMLAAAAAAPVPAAAQTGDPEQGSPSGVIYEIPLDNARRDAAPTKGGGGNGGGTSGSGGSTTAGTGTGTGTGTGGVTTANGSVSPIRSENGFGSSSTVPGVAAKLGGKSGGKKSGSRKSSGSTTAPVMTSPAESLGPPKSAAVTATPSKSRAYLLLALALAVAAGIGVVGRYVARRR